MVESSKLEYPGLLEDFCFTLYVKCLEIALFLLKKKKKKKKKTIRKISNLFNKSVNRFNIIFDLTQSIYFFNQIVAL